MISETREIRDVKLICSAIMELSKDSMVISEVDAFQKT